MKSSHNVIRYDYSKYDSAWIISKGERILNWYSPFLRDYEFWGLHSKNGRIHIDTKRYKKMMEGMQIREFLPEGLLNERNTVYLIPKKQKRHDYVINIFRDLIQNLKTDWYSEYKPLFDKILTPKDVYDKSKLSSIATTSSVDDLDDIEFRSTLASIKRENQYYKITQSLYCQFISKICTEIDRITLIVMMQLGYKGTDFSPSSFYKFSDGILNGKKSVKINDLKKYNAYRMLHVINNFLKHNSRNSYLTLKKLFPDNVCSLENKTAQIDYENGMFAGDWIIIKKDYIDDVLDKILIFFEQYCFEYLGEDIEESKWNYDEYFIHAFKQVCDPNEYFGLYGL